MSAFMVGATHINALVTAGLILVRPYGPLRWYWGEPRKERELNELTQDDVGRMLIAENRRSVDYRYGEEEAVPEYRFKMLPGVPDPVIVLKAIRCYVYQSCETDDWERTEAAAFCESLTVTAIRCLPGYDEAPAWEIRDPFVFVKAELLKR